MRIPDETRLRIVEAMRDLNYNPNGVARNLAQRATRTIAVVMQYPRLFSGGSGFTNELMHGITDSAVAQDYDVMLFTRTPEPHWRDEDAGRVEAEVANLTDGRVDGALLLRDLEDPLAHRLEQCGFPTVLMFTHAPDGSLWYVDCDNVTGGKMATRHLIELGHRRIAHLAGPERSGAGRERRMGYQQALENAGIAVRPEWIREAPEPTDACLAAGDLFAPDVSAQDRPTAVFAWSDNVALQMLRLLRERGLRVPQDVALVGFDSTPLCEHTDPPLTSVRQPVYAMASLAMERLALRLRGETPPETQVRFAPELMVRRSCGAHL